MGFNESDALKRAIMPFLERVINEKTRECLRMYKAIVVSAPNQSTGKCDVRLVGQENTFSLPYSTDVSNVTAGQAVWVATTYNSWRNAVVLYTIDFKHD